jgi:beta-lactamase superfamily II metal-dependent hydrolase
MTSDDDPYRDVIETGGSGDDVTDSTGKILLFPASYGDAIVLEWGRREDRRRLVVDAGFSSSATMLRKYLYDDDAEMPVELFVVTHIDQDHIAGAIPLMSHSWFRAVVKETWFNSRPHLLTAQAAIEHVTLSDDTLGAVAGEKLTKLLLTSNKKWNHSVEGPPVGSAGPPISVGSAAAPTLHKVDLAGGLRITLLSPTDEKLRDLIAVWDEQLPEALEPTDVLGHGRTEPVDFNIPSLRSVAPSSIEHLAATPFKQDTEEPNGSSIAFLAEYVASNNPKASWSALLAADSHPDVLVASLKQLAAERGVERITVDAVKVPHHGSRGNVSGELLQILDCPLWLISTNGKKFDHPHDEAIARIVLGANKPTLAFNYRERAQMWAEVADAGMCRIESPTFGSDGHLEITFPRPSEQRPKRAG